MSITSELVALCRAVHFAFDDPPKVFEDPLAGDLITSPVWRPIAKNRLIYRICLKTVYRGGEVLIAHAVSRARWVEDLLDKAVAAGIGQYVILGAGLDSFAWRRQDLAARVRVYEVDHPATQGAKRKRLAKLKLEPPKNLEFVPIDFEREGLADALARSSYSTEQPAFFSWMGTTMYLSPEAVMQTLGAIASLAAPGSELAFNYNVPHQLLAADDVRLLRRGHRKYSGWSEPMRSTFDPQALSSEVARFGFELVENLSPAEQEARYFAGRREGTRTSPEAYFAHCHLREKGGART
jgi:methyltransferase (TIGR00027 family)